MSATDLASKLEKPSLFSLTLNLLPAVLLATGFAFAVSLFDSPPGAIGFAIAWLFLLPPIAARCLIAMFGKPEGQFTQDTRHYRVWWTLVQLQLPFNRLPWLEETIRLVPGAYSMWIWLWGGRVSPFAFIGPGVLITDRHLVTVERGAVLGMRSAMAGHMVIRDERGRWLVIAAAPRVEAEAILGGDSGLGPGAVLRAGAVLPASRRIAPFVHWPRRGGAEDA